jgi:hypothetical protein
MYCPQCGQQQVSEAVRFCSRCGFPLDAVIQLLASGGMMPVYRALDDPAQMSPRRKGVKQGAVLLLSGAVIVPILGIIASFSPSAFPELLAALAAIICFVGGPFRMLYAALFEEGAPKRVPMYGPPPVVPQQFAPSRPNTALPPPPVHTPPSWRGRPSTGELANRPSVTENTTRLLDKEDHTNR